MENRKIKWAIIALIFAITVSSVSLMISLRNNKQQQAKIEELNKQKSFLIKDKAKEEEENTDIDRVSLLSYQEAAPDLYAELPAKIKKPKGMVYLTFDDGPSPNTKVILDQLKEYDAKATFFVVGEKVEEYPDIVKRIKAEGHTVAVHTDTHDYNKVYQSVDNFIADYEACFNKIKEVIPDEQVDICRLPGGSINAYNSNIYQQLNAELLRRGFVYYDWNVDSGDASSRRASEREMMSAISWNRDKQKDSIVLFHDGASSQYATTILPNLLKTLQQKKITVQKLSNDVMPIFFGYKDYR